MLFLEPDVKGRAFVPPPLLVFWSISVLFGMHFLGNTTKHPYVFKIKIRDGSSNIEKGSPIDANQYSWNKERLFERFPCLKFHKHLSLHYLLTSCVYAKNNRKMSLKKKKIRIITRLYKLIIIKIIKIEVFGNLFF